MNDKDKKAFEEWFLGLDNAHIISAMKLNRGWFEAWQAACEYKQKEVDFLKDRNETNISKVTCVNQVNDGLHILLKEAEAELFEWKEAAKSEANIVNELQAENKKLREALEKITTIRRKDGNDNDYEGSEVYIAREALKEVDKNNNDK